MPNRMAAGPRILGLSFTVGLIYFLCPALSGQTPYYNPYDAMNGVSSRVILWDLENPPPPLPSPPVVAGGPIVSADYLRNPISSRARRMLEKAQQIAHLGNHTGAIAALRQGLAKFPSVAPYVHNLLGIEFVALGQFRAAKEAFALVLESMPHISANHSNYSVTLIALGENDRAEQELRTALALDENNSSARFILDHLRENKEQLRANEPANNQVNAEKPTNIP